MVAVVTTTTYRPTLLEVTCVLFDAAIGRSPRDSYQVEIVWDVRARLQRAAFELKSPERCQRRKKCFSCFVF